MTNTANITPRLIPVNEVISRTGLCRTALYERIKTGEIRPVKLGKKTVFAEAEISDWVNQRLLTRGA